MVLDPSDEVRWKRQQRILQDWVLDAVRLKDEQSDVVSTGADVVEQINEAQDARAVFDHGPCGLRPYRDNQSGLDLRSLGGMSDSTSASRRSTPA